MRTLIAAILLAVASHTHAATEAELLTRAQAGDYQAQRNLAYGYATGDQRIRRDPLAACAWYLLVLQSGSPKIHDGDVGNARVWCDRLDGDMRSAAERRASALNRQIYGNVKP